MRNTAYSGQLLRTKRESGVYNIFYSKKIDFAFFSIVCRGDSSFCCIVGDWSYGYFYFNILIALIWGIIANGHIDSAAAI